MLKIVATVTLISAFIFFNFGSAECAYEKSEMADEIIEAYLVNVGNFILLASMDVIMANINDARPIGGYLDKYNYGQLFAIGSYFVAVSLIINMDSAKAVYTYGEISGRDSEHSWERTLLTSSIAPFLGGAIGLLYGGIVKEKPMIGGIIGFGVGSILCPVSAAIGYNRSKPIAYKEMPYGFSSKDGLAQKHAPVYQHHQGHTSTSTYILMPFIQKKF